jgi:dihydrofolate reductase
MLVSIAVAMTHRYVIGRDGQLPWTQDDVPGELLLFKKTTAGKPVIMGRKTWESLPIAMRPLRGRVNVVLTRNSDWHHSGTMAAEPFDDMPTSRSETVAATPLLTCYRMPFEVICNQLAYAGHAEAVVIGGAQLFAEAYNVADRVYLTLINNAFEGDLYFPRVIFSDGRWTWEPNPVKGKGWTRHILSKEAD